MKKVSFLPRNLAPDISFIGLSFVLIALLSIACDKISSLLNPHANVVLEGEIIVRQDSVGWVDYLGKVKNIGDADAYSITIIFDTYGKDGKLISVDSDLIMPYTLSPGRIASFDAWTTVDWEDYDHYEYKIDWNE